MPRNDGAVLIFGGTGAIGTAIAQRFRTEQWRVVQTSRSAPASSAVADAVVLRVDPFAMESGLESLADFGPFQSVCWAQGLNVNDSVANFDAATHLEVYSGNCLFVLQTLSWLLNRQLIDDGARLCVISSVWQHLARQNKLSYCVSKAALRGLVLSASIDLAPRGILVNSVLPGPLDTPMTRQALTADQIRKLETASPFQRLATVEEVANVVYGLCATHNMGVTGQFIEVDAAFSYARLL